MRRVTMKGFEKIRAVIFDMDGTLLDSMWAWRGENRIFLKRHGYEVPEDLEGGIDTLSSHAFAKRFAEEHSGEFTVDGIMGEYLDSMCRHYETDVFPKKGAEAFLEKLTEAGIRLCVATATPRDIAKNALGIHGLDKYFLFVTDDVEMGAPKSNPVFFDRISERLGVKKEECVIFEDSLYAMKSACQAGVTAFAIEDFVHRGNSELMQKISDTAAVFVKDFEEAIEILF